MKDTIVKRLFYIVLTVVVGFTGYFAGVLVERSGTSAGNYTTQALKIKKLSEIIEQNYYFQDNIDSDEAFDYAMSGYVAQLGDPFSYYLGKDDLSSFNEEVEGNYVGIGVEVTTDASNFIVVMNSFDGSAAQQAGIKTGDRIIQVNQTPVTGDMLDEAVAMIRGPVGETVSLTVLKKDGETKQLELTRTQVTVETVRTKMLTEDIGYVRISSFDIGTDVEFIRKFEELNASDLKGLILDLRSNSGGTLDSVSAIADYLMKEGTIVSIRYTDGSEEVITSDGEQFVNLPICVLIDEGTASAAELLAGGLRDNNGAKLIGMNSFGKGVVGQSFIIDSDSAVVLTVAEYFLPGGVNIHGVGLKPDIEIPLENQTTSVFIMDAAEDTQLQGAIKELTTHE